MGTKRITQDSTKTVWNQSGQAIIEYVIVLTIILGISGLIVGAVRSNRDKMWKRMLCCTVKVRVRNGHRDFVCLSHIFEQCV